MEKNGNTVKDEGYRKIIHPLFLKMTAVKTTGDLYVVGSFPKKGSYLIVSNHVCMEDVKTLCKAVGRNFYLVVDGDNNINNKRIIELLKKRKNVAMYPEGTWNLSPNCFIMPMDDDCIKLSLESNIPIIPIVSLFDFRNRHTVIGEPFVPSSDLNESIINLRDIMSTLIYNEIQRIYGESYFLSPHIFSINLENEKYFHEKRSSIVEDYWDKYIDLKRLHGYESQYIITPNNDEDDYFQEFNSVIIFNSDGSVKKVRRISSEKDGYMDETFGESDKDSFGYGYNEHILKKSLKNKMR